LIVAYRTTGNISYSRRKQDQQNYEYYTEVIEELDKRVKYSSLHVKDDSNNWLGTVISDLLRCRI